MFNDAENPWPPRGSQRDDKANGPPHDRSRGIEGIAIDDPQVPNLEQDRSAEPLSDFDFIAKTFPLPLERNQQPGEVKRDDFRDFPIGIPLLEGEAELLTEADLSGSESLHGGEAWAREDLALWRSQCHLSGNFQSTTSLPATLTVLPPSSENRNCSVISLPISLPDLCDSTATSTTFNLSARDPSGWPNGSPDMPEMIREHHIQQNDKEQNASAQHVNMSTAENYQCKFRCEHVVR
ncbi:hypothetical protein QFC19_001816 [Naganishia cerealis]|uniref:Uncharacterized protein n=1 Tax=Naganishia cerealis TaxID=610337 RepID=A0ACC2WDU6_9TREE|nr:hypothetical protein QFC19_001816 [Naganishia cerealis]